MTDSSPRTLLRFALAVGLGIVSSAPFNASAAPAAKAPTSQASPTRKPVALPPSASKSAQEPAPNEKVLWDAWYTVTVGKGMHYAYYNDRVSLKQGRVHFQNHFWKNEEGFINEEQLGAFALDDADLTPLFYNFHSTYRANETNIDGNVQDGKIITVKIRKNGKELPLVKLSMPSRTIFSALFPVWLGRKLPQLQNGKSLSFYSILEDNLEVAFSAVPGNVKLLKPNELSTQTKTSRVAVNYRDLPSEWYLDSQGMPIRIEMPSQETLIQKVSEQEARKFLAE